MPDAHLSYSLYLKSIPLGDHFLLTKAGVFLTTSSQEKMVASLVGPEEQGESLQPGSVSPGLAGAFH